MPFLGWHLIRTTGISIQIRTFMDFLVPVLIIELHASGIHSTSAQHSTFRLSYSDFCGGNPPTLQRAQRQPAIGFVWRDAKGAPSCDGRPARRFVSEWIPMLPRLVPLLNWLNSKNFTDPPPRLTLRTITYLVDDSNHSETN